MNDAYKFSLLDRLSYLHNKLVDIKLELVEIKHDLGARTSRTNILHEQEVILLDQVNIIEKALDNS